MSSFLKHAHHSSDLGLAPTALSSARLLLGMLSKWNDWGVTFLPLIVAFLSGQDTHR